MKKIILSILFPALLLILSSCAAQVSAKPQLVLIDCSSSKIYPFQDAVTSCLISPGGPTLKPASELQKVNTL